MPNRFAATIRCCARMSESAPTAGSTGAVPNGRVSCPRPVGQDRVEVDVVVHVVLVRGDILAVVGCPDPHAVELRDLLGRRHGGDERVDPLVDGSAASRHGAAVDAGLVERHPFTAPVRPPTICFSIARKNTSAGIIASDV